MSDEKIKIIIKDFLKEFKSTNWHIMLDDNGELIKVNKPFKNDLVITNRIDTMRLVNIIMSKEINDMKVKIDEMIKEEI